MTSMLSLETLRIVTMGVAGLLLGRFAATGAALLVFTARRPDRESIYFGYAVPGLIFLALSIGVAGMLIAYYYVLDVRGYIILSITSSVSFFMSYFASRTKREEDNNPVNLIGVTRDQFEEYIYNALTVGFLGPIMMGLLILSIAAVLAFIVPNLILGIDFAALQIVLVATAIASGVMSSWRRLDSDRSVTRDVAEIVRTELLQRNLTEADLQEALIRGKDDPVLRVCKDLLAGSWTHQFVGERRGGDSEFEIARFIGRADTVVREESERRASSQLFVAGMLFGMILGGIGVIASESIYVRSTAIVFVYTTIQSMVASYWTAVVAEMAKRRLYADVRNFAEIAGLHIREYLPRVTAEEPTPSPAPRLRT